MLESTVVYHRGPRAGEKIKQTGTSWKGREEEQRGRAARMGWIDS